ncbi:hypothetical protein QMK19_00060 [Streptomyces sp. H10-C2]|uniref:hypothetical protein n=1 Tax=unclassified Streptomyces TaxID=2593676 RepID=UPI0024BADDEC|nr:MULTISPECIES: hypothetical protein [unclassified Streptomyces]MDJ0340435.1 hypothetical protein [Streptomyces sp. PH10-H1]MDJ0368117.1 hypothetical protein [Streptomyces sp. H10-C2]
MTTMTFRPVPVVGGTTGGTVRLPVDEPIFAELAGRWAAAGRLVPGQDDREWTALASRCPWPVR